MCRRGCQHFYNVSTEPWILWYFKHKTLLRGKQTCSSKKQSKFSGKFGKNCSAHYCNYLLFSQDAERPGRHSHAERQCH